MGTTVVRISCLLAGTVTVAGCADDEPWDHPHAQQGFFGLFADQHLPPAPAPPGPAAARETF